VFLQYNKGVMKQHILKAFLVFSLALFLTPGAFVSAQLIGSTDASLVNDHDIDVALTPEQPRPNQNVTIELSSYATEMNKATITWSVNGTTKLNGIGKTKLSITTGDVGQKTDVSIVIITQEGTRVDKRIVITPAQLDILWEAPETYDTSRQPRTIKRMNQHIIQERMNIRASILQITQDVEKATLAWGIIKDIDYPEITLYATALSIYLRNQEMPELSSLEKMVSYLKD
jgi:hypothetical protein